MTLSRTQKRRDYYKAYREKNRAKINKRSNEFNKIKIVKIKTELYQIYGNKCACEKCPETNPSFLTLDHINNDGGKEKKVVGHGTGFYYYVMRQIKAGHKNRYRLMCYNCNCGRARNKGVCPHISFTNVIHN